MFSNFQNFYLTEAIDNILSGSDVLDEDFSEAVRRQAALLAGVNSDDLLYWWSDSLQ